MVGLQRELCLLFECKLFCSVVVSTMFVVDTEMMFQQNRWNSKTGSYENA